MFSVAHAQWTLILSSLFWLTVDINNIAKLGNKWSSTNNAGSGWKHFREQSKCQCCIRNFLIGYPDFENFEFLPNKLAHIGVCRSSAISTKEIYSKGQWQCSLVHYFTLSNDWIQSWCDLNRQHLILSQLYYYIEVPDRYSVNLIRNIVLTEMHFKPQWIYHSFYPTSIWWVLQGVWCPLTNGQAKSESHFINILSFHLEMLSSFGKKCGFRIDHE